jgi:hypothetical protein
MTDRRLCAEKGWQNAKPGSPARNQVASRKYRPRQNVKKPATLGAAGSDFTQQRVAYWLF